jgi:hypothetical protein
MTVHICLQVLSPSRTFRIKIAGLQVMLSFQLFLSQSVCLVFAFVCQQPKLGSLDSTSLPQFTLYLTWI